MLVGCCGALLKHLKPVSICTDLCCMCCVFVRVRLAHTGRCNLLKTCLSITQHFLRLFLRRLCVHRCAWSSLVLQPQLCGGRDVALTGLWQRRQRVNCPAECQKSFIVSLCNIELKLYVTYGSKCLRHNSYSAKTESA